MGKVIVHVEGACKEKGQMTLCGELAFVSARSRNKLTRDFRKADCPYCLRTMLVRAGLEADAADKELRERDRRIDTLEKGLDVLLDKCLEGRIEKRAEKRSAAAADKPAVCRMILPDGSVRLIGVSAAARWLGCSTPALSQIARGKAFYAGTLEQKARIEFPELFKP
jgi:hypothetical protein